MALKVYSDLLEEIEEELDLETEDFIQPSEMIRYVNKGIKRAHAIMVRLGMADEYYKTREFLALVSGTQAYDFPATCYSEKIKEIRYRGSSQNYEIKKLKGKRRFERATDAELYPTQGTNDYAYDILNAGTTKGAQLYFFPIPTEDSSENVQIWFLRQAELVEDADSLVDIPEELDQYLMEFVRWRVIAKENVGVAPQAKEDFLEFEKQFIETLTGEVDNDDASTFDMDLSSYDEMS
jgi:hypothetical protein